MKKTKSKKQKLETKKPNIAGAGCEDKNCPVHGNLKTHGKVFEGKVVKKFQKRIVIEFEKMVYVKKYERYYKHKTRLHARLPECMEKEIQIGNLVRIQECRPLSKLVHFAVLGKVKKKEKKKNEN